MRGRIRNKLVALVLAVTMFSASGINIDAADIAEIPSTEVDSVYNLAVDSNSWANWAPGPQIYSESGIVMDVDSGAILYAKNIDDKHYPASITKVMTALVALQHYEMDEIVHFTWDDIRFLEYGDAHIGIKPDEELTMEDCMFGMLLASANEVSHAIGAHMEGGFDEFLRVMNETSKELGCKNSNWMNTHGLHDPEHYTSCYDMALISSEVFKYDKFREITNTYQHIIPVTNITNEQRYVHQNHKMLRDWDQRYYEYCVGGKTGYTDQALTTLVTYATKKDANNQDVNLVAVVMRTHGGGNNAYVDTEAMLNYGFDNFSKIKIAKDVIGDESKIEKMEEEAYVMLPNTLKVEDVEIVKEYPSDLGDKTGKIIFQCGEACVGEMEMIISQEYYNKIHNIKEVEMDKNDKDDKKSLGLGLVWKIILGTFLFIVAAFFALLFYVDYKRKLKRKRRRERSLQERQQRERQLEEQGEDSVNRVQDLIESE